MLFIWKFFFLSKRILPEQAVIFVLHSVFSKEWFN